MLSVTPATVSKRLVNKVIYKGERMMEKNYISGTSELVGKKRTRIYYHLEEEGKKALAEMKNDYASISTGISNVLNTTGSTEKE